MDPLWKDPLFLVVLVVRILLLPADHSTSTLLQSMAVSPYRTWAYLDEQRVRSAMGISGDSRVPPLVQWIDARACDAMGPAYRPVLGLLVDVGIAYLWRRLAVWWNKQRESKDREEEALEEQMDERLRPSQQWSIPMDAARWYWCWSLLSTSGYGNVRLLCLLLSVAAERSLVWSATCLSVGTYLDVTTVCMVIPVYLLRGRSAVFLLCFGLILGSLYALDILGGGDVAAHLRFAFEFRVPPSLSLTWYLSMQLYDRFRLYFTYLLGGLPFLVALPLAIRLHEYPMALVRVLCVCFG